MINFLFILIYIGVCFFSVYTSICEYAINNFIWKLSLSQWSSVIPVFLVLMFGFFSYIKYRNNQEKLLYTANTAYFLGYMGTIASIISLVFILPQNGLDNSDGLIIQSICVALTTTLAGLIVMHVIKTHSQQLLPNSGIVNAVMTNIQEETSVIKQSMYGLSSELNGATQQVKSFREETLELQQQMEHNHGTIIEINKMMGQIASNFKTASEAFLSINECQLSDDVIKGLKEGLLGLRDVVNSLVALNPILNNIHKSFAELENNITSLGSSTQQSQTILSQFDVGVKEINRILSDFAELEKTILDEKDDKRKTQSEVITLLSKNIEQLNHIIVAMSKKREFLEHEEDKKTQTDKDSLLLKSIDSLVVVMKRLDDKIVLLEHRPAHNMSIHDSKGEPDNIIKQAGTVINLSK